MNKTFDQNDVNTNKGLAIVISIFSILFFLPLVMDDKKNSAYLKHVANQTLIVLITSIAFSVIGWVILLIPGIGKIIYGLLYLALFVLAILNIVNAVQANGKSLPVIGTIEITK